MPSENPGPENNYVRAIIFNIDVTRQLAAHALRRRSGHTHSGCVVQGRISRNVRYTERWRGRLPPYGQR